MPRHGNRLWQALVLLAVGAVVLSACAEEEDTGGGGGKKRVAIAFVGALTGPNANLGINPRNGAKVAVQEANERSQRFEYVLREFDTQGDPAQATTQKDKFVTDREILGVVGPIFSGETKAVLPDLQQAPLVMVSPSATNVQLPTVVPDQTVFHRVIPDDDLQGKGLSDYITKRLRARRIAYVHDNTDYGKGLADGTQQLLEKAGTSSAGQEVIDPKGQDYSAAVNKMKALNADVIFYGGYYAEAGRLKKQLTDGGVTTRFMSGDGALDKGFIDASGAAGGEGAQITCACKLANPDAPGALGAFARKYKELNGSDPGTYSSEGYDAANILIQGIEAGNDTREKLLQHIEALPPYQGVFKTIEFESNGNVKTAGSGVFVYEVKEGKLVELGTTDELVGAQAGDTTTTTTGGGQQTTTTAGGTTDGQQTTTTTRRTTTTGGGGATTTTSLPVG